MIAGAENIYLSVEQVAARYNVSKDSIWRWRREGDFPKPVRLGGNTSRWRLSELEAYEAERPCAFATHLAEPWALPTIS
ncbi:helix-turn-helix transcriptional regulator [Oceaniglobus roseus]|uniref:helix-turn-helix transcriptional regulator n=1 Tax=Oceaniglobus roseus TaxID=1737570 RepID=UPI0015624207|nr:helix-turn-helix domain-containing protein [Kandeliimicrobium roseum]